MPAPSCYGDEGNRELAIKLHKIHYKFLDK